MLMKATMFDPRRQRRELLDSRQHHSILNTINRTKKSAIMTTVSANELKTKGVKAIEEALLRQTEVEISVHGKGKYVVMSVDQYQYLRECELDAALARTKADLEAGRFVKESVAEHLDRLDRDDSTLNYTSS